MVNVKTADEIWVLGELSADGGLLGTVFELSACARRLADSLAAVTGSPHRVTAVFLGSGGVNRAIFEETGRFGADMVLTANEEWLRFDRASCGKLLAHMVRASADGPPKIIIASAAAYGRSVMPYAAALLKTGLTADCTGLDIEPESGLLLQTRPAIGGSIMAAIKTPGHRPQMATVRPGIFPLPAPDDSGRAGVFPFEIPETLRPSVETISFSRFSPEEGALKDREAVVSGGRGLRRADGFKLISALAAALGAGVGASRPAVEMKWIGYPHQVGLSGQAVSPKVYIAAGISGSVQHLAGMQTSGKIISINKDPDARIFRVSDAAICGDLYEVIPKLMERIKEIKEGPE
ncbi:MAG: electron transfer flavoprotein subunit alpha/FixB family protein [Synergistaceae bacterium]|jgi:electron transfer flavoprotein alpha subunit|nr:electron transfer flavoprotein subunit alpha/FixB family protein [Synergistaceae bacterium]